MKNHELFKTRTGGFIAPISVMEYDPDGRCIATLPLSGITVLDQFAMSVISDIFKCNADAKIDIGTIAIDMMVETSYRVAAAMLRQKIEIEKGC